ncbi:hypothetical protein OKW23_001513, partial [Bacilli bacterium PM5-9]|nr:hypothetical protein [Bacilli bacterium PM5-9]
MCTFKYIKKTLIIFENAILNRFLFFSIESAISSSLLLIYL